MIAEAFLSEHLISKRLPALCFSGKWQRLVAEPLQPEQVDVRLRPVVLEGVDFRNQQFGGAVVSFHEHGSGEEF